MARECYDFQSDEWVSPEEYARRKAERNGHIAVSHLACPMVISDSLGADLRHPVTGLYADSKSAFRSMTKASGCVEVGNDAPTTMKPKQRNVKAEKANRVQALKGAMRESGVDVL